MKLSETVLCEGCGSQLLVHSAICPKCSERIDAEVAAVPMTAKQRLKCISRIVGTFFFWGGHFFLIGFPVLFVIYHLLYYRGGGTSGVPLGLSMFYVAPMCYGIGAVLRLISKPSDSDGPRANL